MFSVTCQKVGKIMGNAVSLPFGKSVINRAGKSLQLHLRIMIALVLLFAVAFATPATPIVTKAAETATMNRRLLDDINDLRASQGLGSLQMDSSLISIASIRADEASSKWSHTRPNGQQGVDMISKDKWRGENLSYVIYPDYSGMDSEQYEAAEVMFDNLVASPTHYDNMVFDSFTRIGIASSVVDTSSGTRITTAYMFSN